jgi:hypothetical protein
MRSSSWRSRAAVLAAALLLGLATAALAGGAGAGAADAARGLQAEIFDAPDLTGSPVVTRVDPTVDFDWDLAEPVAGVGDTFSVRWSGTVTPRHSERYTFITRSDDGVRLYVDGRPVIDDFTMHSTRERSGTVNLTAGRAHQIELEYFDGVKHADVRLEWRSRSQAREVVPQSALAPPDGSPSQVATEPVATVPAAPGTPETGTTPVPVPPAGPPVEGAIDAAGDAVLPPPATPVAGESFNAAPEGDGVLVRRPGDDGVVALAEPASLPVGTRVDVRDGAVELQTAPAAGVRRRVQRARFSGGNFRVGQPRRGDRVVTIDLIHGEFAEECGDQEPSAGMRARVRAKARLRARAAARKRVLRTLWGSGKGRFRTRGRHAAATVRGTVWNVEDRCGATVVRVKEGVVDVEDLDTGRTVAVEAGEQYVADGR